MDISPNELRRVLDDVLRTDADLVAFAIDAKLSAGKRFSDGMDRVAKINLILQTCEADGLLGHLRALYPNRTADALARLSVAGTQDAQTAQHQAATPSNPKLVRREGSEERKLTVRLRLDDAGRLQVDYAVPAYPAFAQVQADPLEELEKRTPQLRFDGRTGLAAVVHLLDDGDDASLVRLLTGSAVTGEQGLGRLLYSLLFPDASAERRVLGHLIEDSVPNSEVPPIRQGVAVRIWTDEPAFIGLPWRLTCWKGHLLADHGWTFAVTPDPVPNLPVRLSALSRVLVVAPLVPSLLDLNSQAHVDELRQQLAAGLPAQGKDEWFRVVHDRAELETALQAMPFDVLYYYGHGSLESGQVCLRLGDGDSRKSRLTPADLLRLCPEAPPKLVLLNACFGGAAGWQSAGHLLSPKVPVVVCSLTTAFTHFAAAMAIRFLKGVLLERRDPVDLLHERDPSDPAQTLHDWEWATHAVFARYTSWEPTTLQAQRHDPRNPLRLDRTRARAEVFNQVYALVDGSKRRVEAMVAYGQDRSLVEQFSWQAIDHLTKLRAASVAPLHLKFPQDRSDLYQRLCEDFRQQVTRPGEPLQHALRRHAPRVRTAGKPVLWLNWGVCGDGERQDKLTLDQLRCWLKWSSEFLCQDNHCPEDLRIVSFVALRRPLDKYEVLEKNMENYQHEFGGDRFRAWLLTPLPRVKKGEIKDYLSDPDLCGCADNAITVAKATELIHRDTDGHYEQVVQHIEWAEKHGWQSLLDRLKQKLEPKSRPPESEDI
ncbi:MAG TPA: hypothetical protein PKE31_19825 [Pseudomonadota bacterium]|nr:hypothetical protein [Pseudomonadota bacterium]